jgi:gas vesicle protein
MNTALKVLSGFIAGAAIGTIAGIIIAPDKGRNTLKKIKEESKYLSDEIVGSLSNSLHKLTHAYGDKAERGKEYENGKLERSKAHG